MEATIPGAPEKHRATLELARRLCAYGQADRALAVLDLSEWIWPGQITTRHLRISALVRLKRWDDALDLVLENRDGLDGRLVAEICWSLGDTALGDHFFHAAGRTVPPTLIKAARRKAAIQADRTVPFVPLD